MKWFTVYVRAPENGVQCICWGPGEWFTVYEYVGARKLEDKKKYHEDVGIVLERAAENV